MKDVRVKAEEGCELIMAKALDCAIEFSKTYSDRKYGAYYGVLWIHMTNIGNFGIYVHHTKSSINNK